MPPTKLDAGPAAEPRRSVFVGAARPQGATERRWRAAAAGKARLATLLPAAIAEMAPFYIADLTGKLLHANDAYANLADCLPGETAGFAPLPPATFAEIVAAIKAGSATKPREIAPVLGQADHWRVQHSGIFDGVGRLTAISGTLHDISDLVVSRDQLYLAQERLDDMTRLASDWVWETNSRLALTYVSSRVGEVLAFQPIELIGRSFLDLVHFLGEDETASPFDPLARKPFRDRPATIAHRDGTPRLFQISALPIFATTTGDFLGFRGTARDITAHAAASERATQLQTQLTQAIESISEGFALFDPTDHLVLCNDRFRRSFGRVAERIVPGISFENFIRLALDAGEIVVPEGERDAWLQNRLRIRSEHLVSFDVKLRDERWIKVSDHRTADGSLVGIRTDITDLKNREEALFAAKESAEIASRSKSDFLANISHELRTPLNAIIGFSEIMREELFGPLGSPQYREYIGDVFDSAQHLLNVINDILDIAKAEAGKLELVEDEVEIYSIVGAATRLIQERAQRGQVAIRIRLPPGLPTLEADERKLKQILLNLLTNAVKFTPPGGTIEVAGGLTDGGDFLVTVTDSGIGIAAEDITTALAPFGQVDSKLARKYEGTGLGLPLSNAMVKLHGGELTIDSVVGEGTTVTVRLPASRIHRG
ncbi:MAG TPA: ATP-binding protein [Stellaceae bacterium]|nr:ATP-binding protein [Stellaceae bacterium]